jgi:uncharacterized protein DUF4287
VSLQAYLDNIKTKTGKTPADFKRLADAKGLLRPGVKAGEVVAWLKSDFGLGRGHALAIVLTLKSATQPKSSADDSIAKHFGGDKARWRKPLRPVAVKNQRVWAGRFGGHLPVPISASFARERSSRSFNSPPNDLMSASNSRENRRPLDLKQPERGTAWSLIGCVSPSQNRLTTRCSFA